jgi:hypothetical protein
VAKKKKKSVQITRANTVLSKKQKLSPYVTNSIENIFVFGWHEKEAHAKMNEKNLTSRKYSLRLATHYLDC